MNRFEFRLFMFGIKMNMRRRMVPLYRIAQFWRSYHEYEDGRGCRLVFVDGEEIKECKSFDYRKGWAERYVQPIVVVDGDLATEMVYGKVTFKYV